MCSASSMVGIIIPVPNRPSTSDTFKPALSNAPFTIFTSRSRSLIPSTPVGDAASIAPTIATFPLKSLGLYVMIFLLCFHDYCLLAKKQLKLPKYVIALYSKKLTNRDRKALDSTKFGFKTKMPASLIMTFKRLFES